ncbi:hypothetical protein NESM_000817900 [Novymonas esmeraldas]|uniref:Uncharacterized protein n=1 Tax=Novymonas esmeraldas TaxID=1808958 RepID=A0AAW0EZ31_9TRYP
MWEGRQTGAGWGESAAVTHRSRTAAAAPAAASAAATASWADGTEDDREELAALTNGVHRVPRFLSEPHRGVGAAAWSRPPTLRRALAATTSTSSATARSHSPAVWVFHDDPDDDGNDDGEEYRTAEDYASAGHYAGDRGRDAPVSQPTALQRRGWATAAEDGDVDDGDVDDGGAVQAPSPRVLDNRLRLVSSPATAAADGGGGGGASGRSARLASRPAAVAQRGEARPAAHHARSNGVGDTDTKEAAAVLSSSVPRQAEARRRRGADTGQPADDAVRSLASHTASPPPSTLSSSPTSPASSSAAVPAALSPPRLRAAATVASPAPSPLPGGVEHVGGSLCSGLGPLLVVHLDYVPSDDAAGVTDAATAPPTTSSSSSPVHPVHLDPYWGAVMAQQAADTHEREVAALHARLEGAEQRVRVAEQQVLATAELRAAELTSGYKAEERKRRAQFQATLDALREENRDLSAKLEAAARAPAMGVLAAPALFSAASTEATAAGGLVAGGGGGAVSQVEVTRQLQSIEAYWRDRLRTAERHWEDEMARQTRQRREALDQVEELVRTLEQSQEELRYTRRQAARLREENARLCSAAALAPSPSTGPTATTEEVARLRQAVKEREHKEAALMAQVESYAEEATAVRLRSEAALERAEHELAAERRRSAEMVKLYGSQLESLHHQLHDAKARGAAR